MSGVLAGIALLLVAILIALIGIYVEVADFSDALTEVAR